MFEPGRVATRPCATLPESTSPTQRARTAIVEATRDRAIRSSGGYGIRPCSPSSFSHRYPDEHGRYERACADVSGGDRIFTALGRTSESVRDDLRPKIRIARINICY